MYVCVCVCLFVCVCVGGGGGGAGYVRSGNVMWGEVVITSCVFTTAIEKG